MASYEIVKVRTVQPPGYSHPHISHVQLAGDSRVWTRETIIKDIGNGHAFHTRGGGYTADVIVVRCPFCSARDYITTEPDSTTANNLLSLPSC